MGAMSRVNVGASAAAERASGKSSAARKMRRPWDGLQRRLAECGRGASEMCGGEARGLRQPAAAVAEGSLLPAARSKRPPDLLRPARSRLRPPHSGSRLPQSTVPDRHLQRRVGDTVCSPLHRPISSAAPFLQNSTRGSTIDTPFGNEGGGVRFETHRLTAPRACSSSCGAPFPLRCAPPFPCCRTPSSNPRRSRARSSGCPRRTSRSSASRRCART